MKQNVSGSLPQNISWEKVQQGGWVAQIRPPHANNLNEKQCHWCSSCSSQDSQRSWSGPALSLWECVWQSVWGGRGLLICLMLLGGGEEQLAIGTARCSLWLLNNKHWSVLPLLQHSHPQLLPRGSSDGGQWSPQYAHCPEIYGDNRFNDFCSSVSSSITHPI